MKLLTVTTFLVLLVGTEGIFDFLFGGVFSSVGEAASQVADAVKKNAAEISSMLKNTIVPEVKETLKIVRKSVEEVVNMTKSLEERIEKSLNKLDDVIGNIGKNVNHVVDITICIACVLLFFLCSYFRSSARNGYLVYQYLTFLVYTSLTTATGVLLRVFCSSFLQCELGRAATIMLCVGLPIVLVVARNLLRLAHYIFTCVRPVVYFLILGPRLIILVTLDGPFRWVWGAYKLAEEEKSRKFLFITISLPWLAVTVCPLTYGMLVYHQIDDVSALWMGLLTSYLYFYFNAVCLYFCYQPLSPRERLRKLHGGASTCTPVPQRHTSGRPYQQIPYRTQKIKYY